MPGANHQTEAAATRWRYVRVWWALLPALLVLIGLTNPRDAVARPAVEYGALQGLATTGPEPRVTIRAKALEARADGSHPAPASVPAGAAFDSDALATITFFTGPSYDRAPSSPRRNVLCRSYEATGPPLQSVPEPA